jgi:cytochrome c peroxidase
MGLDSVMLGLHSDRNTRTFLGTILGSSLWVLVVGSFVGCASSHAPEPAENPANLQMFAAAISPPQDPNRVALGRLLFHDTRLSKNREISCNTCHVLTTFGIDGKVVSSGFAGRNDTRNTPTVFNAATHIAQFWDGRAADVEAQALVPITNPVEMAMPNEQAVVDALSVVPRYVEMFRAAFPNDERPISLKNVGEAIGAFERGLVTTSRWDRFVSGDRAALTQNEKKGLSVFMQRGCIACHMGPEVGGASFQKVGVMYPWPNQIDQGRAGITHFPADRMVFKVPSLKNIAETAPYFHDGSTTTLETAIQLMGHYELGIELSPEEISAVAAWMRSMTGQPDPTYIAVPQLPPG